MGACLKFPTAPLWLAVVAVTVFLHRYSKSSVQELAPNRYILLLQVPTVQEGRRFGLLGSQGSDRHQRQTGGQGRLCKVNEHITGSDRTQGACS